MSSSLFILLGISAVLAVGFGEKVAFTDCGSQEATITSINISDCDSLPCLFKKGTNVSVEIGFKANKNITEASSQVHGIILGFHAPFPLPDSNSCHFMECPVSLGSDVTYRQSIYVEPLYPSLNVEVQWKLVSPSGNIVCFQVSASVES